MHAHFHAKLKQFQQSFFPQYFLYILQLTYQLILSCTYSFHSLNIHQYHMIYHIHTQITWIQNWSCTTCNLIKNSLHSNLHLSFFQRCLLLQTLASNLHLNLHISCHAMCLVLLALEIRLNTLTFKFLTISRTQNCTYALLILLQLPLHLLVLILKGKSTGSLHSWLFTEIQNNKFTLVKVDKNIIPVRKDLLINPNILLYHVILFH